MNKGQAHLAVILIIILAVIVSVIIIGFVLMTGESSTPWVDDSWGDNTWVQPPSTSALPGLACNGGIYDCNLNCVDTLTANSYVGDYDCDDGVNTQYNFNCPEFNNDNGDCSSSTTPPSTGNTGSSWCPAGLTQPFVVGGLSGSGTVIGMETYEGYSLCKASLSIDGQTYTFYGNEDSSVFYLLDSQGSLAASHQFPMGIDSSGQSTGAWDWMIEGSYTTISHSMYADFVNSKVVPGDSWPDCDLEVTPFSKSGASQGTLGFRSCNDGQIADVGVVDPYEIWKMDSSAFVWEDNPTVVDGHVYIVQARDNSEHYVEVTSINTASEEVTFSWVAA
jgi:hypothetical protein